MNALFSMFTIYMQHIKIDFCIIYRIISVFFYAHNVRIQQHSLSLVVDIIKVNVSKLEGL